MIAGLALFAGGAAAGLFGSLLGLGGGILIVPLLTLGFGIHVREAVAISLVSVIVTSSASAGVYLQRHVANLRLGMVLELFTASGALAGGLVAFMLSDRMLAGLFAGLMAWVAITMLRRREPPERTIVVPSPSPTADPPAPEAVSAGGRDPRPAASGAMALRSGRGATFADRLGGPGYGVRQLPVGMVGSVFAGVMSAVLGVGGGIVKVPLMHLVMGVPLKVAAATSNMMIGITATSSAVIYLLRGEVDPYAAGPTAVGVFLGAALGSRIAGRLDVRLLRWLFIAILVYTAYEMTQRALGA